MAKRFGDNNFIFGNTPKKKKKPFSLKQKKYTVEDIKRQFIIMGLPNLISLLEVNSNLLASLMQIKKMIRAYFYHPILLKTVNNSIVLTIQIQDLEAERADQFNADLQDDLQNFIDPDVLQTIKVEPRIKQSQSCVQFPEPSPCS